MRKNHLLYCFSLILICLTMPAWAQTTRFSSSEDIAIAFYRTGNLQPNYSGWIETSSPYIDTPWAQRDKIMHEQKQRLYDKYNEFDPLNSDIRLRTKVRLIPEVVIEELEDNITGTSYFLNIEFVSGDDITYFPYHHAKQDYAVMPYSMKKITKTAIDAQQYDYYVENVIPNRAYQLIVHMRAKEAVTEKPFEMHGKYRWVLKTDIASSEVWGNRGALLWEYTAPWYVSPELEKLQKIYDLKPTQSPSKGSIKPFIQNDGKE